MRHLFVAAALISFFVAVGWADPPAAVAPSATEIDQLIRQLGDKRFAVREQASKKFWQIGAAAEPALRRVVKDGDVEVSQRAKALLDKFDWGIFPDTPEPVAAQLERYRDGDDDIRRQAATALSELGPPGFQALARLRGRAESGEQRHLLAEAMTLAVTKALPGLLKARDYGTLESLLESSFDHGADDAIANYTALIVLRNKLPAALARWQTEHAATPTPRAAEVLAYLHRAAGDFAAARKCAAARAELLDDILWEQGDWTALATRPAASRNAAVDHAVRAAYFRLAGDAKAAAEQLEKLGKLDDPAEEEAIIKGLLLNEKLADALERLSKTPAFREKAFDLLVGQMRYREAFALADKPPDGDDEDRRKFSIQRARALYLIGEHDQAGQLFAQVAAELKSPVDGPVAAELVQMQMRLGRRDAAREAAAGYLGELDRLSANIAIDPTQRVFEAAFPKRGGEAKTWWPFLRQKFPKDDEQAIMRRLRGLLEPTGPAPADLADLASGLIAAASEDNPYSIIRARLAAATACEAAGQMDAAIGHLNDAIQRSRQASYCIRLGDLYAAAERYHAAEEAYAKAAARDPDNPLPLYLQAWALTKDGQAAAAEAFVEQARLLSLGDTRKRALVAEELSKRELLDFARRERELIQQLGWHRAWAAGGFLSQLARDAAARKQFDRAADYYERVVVALVGSEYQFVENSSYLTVPALAHAHRARAALAADQLDTVRAEAAACFALTPGNIDLATLLVPELAKRGRGGDADAIYSRVSGVYVEMCKDHPGSAFAHNSAAWLAACCRRDLDSALAHARKAVELTPKFAGYRDTLAEVHFQRGDKTKAITLMKECQQMEPKNAYFAKQLKRFEAGDPSVPPPPEIDDD